MNNMKNGNSWDKTAEETADDYVKFGCFLNLGSNRTLNNAALLWDGKERETKGNKNPLNSTHLSRFEKLSSKHNWYERASEYDLHRLKIAQKETEEKQLNAFSNQSQILSLLSDTLLETLKEAIDSKNGRDRLFALAQWGALVTKKSDLLKGLNDGLKISHTCQISNSDKNNPLNNQKLQAFSSAQLEGLYDND